MNHDRDEDNSCLHCHNQNAPHYDWCLEKKLDEAVGKLARQAAELRRLKKALVLRMALERRCSEADARKILEAALKPARRKS